MTAKDSLLPLDSDIELISFDESRISYRLKRTFDDDFEIYRDDVIAMAKYFNVNQEEIEGKSCADVQRRRVGAIIDAYQDGLDAGERNNLEENPHPHDTEEHYAWRRGESGGVGRQEEYRKGHL